MKVWVVRAENLLATLALGGVMTLPLAEIIWRKLFGQGIEGSALYAQHLTAWVALLGGAIAARDGKLLSLATSEFMPKGRLGEIAHVLSAIVTTAVAAILAFGAWELLQIDRSTGDLVANRVPLWVSDLVLPIGFGLIALRLAWRCSPHWVGRAIGALGIAGGYWCHTHSALLGSQTAWPWLSAVIAAGLLGGPIFALLGGIAIFLTFAGGNPSVQLLIRGREVLMGNGLALIPLFTMTGLLLAEGKSSERLLRFLRAMVGWAPGGTAIAAAILCAFFTLFTGGSGVTILVLGGLLLPALLADNYRERFSIGLLTASGSLGLLFPLSVPLMLYAIVSRTVQMEDLFVGGLLPGLLLLGLLAALGIREGLTTGAKRTPFRIGEAVAATWNAKWELLLPFVIIGSIVGGIAQTLAEAAPIAAVFTLIVQRFIHKDLPTWNDLLRVMGDCVTLVGSVLLILSVASGLTDYFVNARVTDTLIEWTTGHVHSPLLFLLGLNLFLLVVGTVMDIFSAIAVVAPLVIPLAAAYQVDPIHLGIIFVANLELGFLHPPLGLNLMLASIRFKKPVLEVTWATLPMLGILAIGVLLITYVPFLTLGLLSWLRPPG